MLKVRVIPCLDVKEGRVVKGVNFVDLRDAGDPVEAARAYDAAGADELCFLDIAASQENRGTLLDLASRTAEQCFMPLTVGGGVRTVEDVRALLLAGADKVSFNTAAVADPGVISAAAEKFGGAVHHRRDRRQDRGAGEVGDLHPRRDAADGDRRGGLRARDGAARGGGDPADLDGPRRHARRLQPAADPGGRRCGRDPGDRLRRASARSSIWWRG